MVAVLRWERYSLLPRGLKCSSQIEVIEKKKKDASQIGKLKSTKKARANANKQPLRNIYQVEG
jgi:hypothetical protein